MSKKGEKRELWAIYVSIQLNPFQVGWIDVRGRIHQVKKREAELLLCILLQLLNFSFLILIL